MNSHAEECRATMLKVFVMVSGAWAPSCYCVVMEVVFDNAYLDALKRQDPKAEEQLVCCFSSHLRTSLRQRLHDRHMVEDATQETMLRVLRFFRTGRTLQLASNLPAFVRSVSHRVSLEMLRHSIRDQQLSEESDDTADNRASLEALLIIKERRQIVRRSMADLTEKEQLLLKLVFLDGADKNQICRQFSTNRTYLRVVLCRAKRHLKSAVERRALS